MFLHVPVHSIWPLRHVLEFPLDSYITVVCSSTNRDNRHLRRDVRPTFNRETVTEMASPGIYLSPCHNLVHRITGPLAVRTLYQHVLNRGECSRSRTMRYLNSLRELAAFGVMGKNVWSLTLIDLLTTDS